MISIHDEDIIRRLFKHHPNAMRQAVDRLRDGISSRAEANGVTRLEAWDAMVAVCREWLDKKEEV